jgi:hypothetical protein
VDDGKIRADIDREIAGRLVLEECQREVTQEVGVESQKEFTMGDSLGLDQLALADLRNFSQQEFTMGDSLEINGNSSFQISDLNFPEYMACAQPDYMACIEPETVKVETEIESESQYVFDVHEQDSLWGDDETMFYSTNDYDYNADALSAFSYPLVSKIPHQKALEIFGDGYGEYMEALGQATQSKQDPFESCLQLDDDVTVLTELNLDINWTLPQSSIQPTHGDSPDLSPERIESPSQTLFTHDQSQYLDIKITTTVGPTPDLEFREITWETPNEFLAMSIILGSPEDSFCSPGESDSEESLDSPEPIERDLLGLGVASIWDKALEKGHGVWGSIKQNITSYDTKPLLPEFDLFKTGYNGQTSNFESGIEAMQVQDQLVKS